VGTISSPVAGALGFVDVWAGTRRLARQEIFPGEVQPAVRQIAEITFVLNQAVGELDYRLWIDRDTAVLLERVELISENVHAR
jgi:hypothetical protein